MILKAILCVQHFCSLSTMLFIVNLLIKTDSTVVCVPCLSMFVMLVCYEPFSLKIADLEDIFCKLVEFFVLSEIQASKTRFKQINENVYAGMFWEPVY